MQTFFLCLTALAVGVIARKKGRSTLGWAVVAAAVFLVVDTIAALLLLAFLDDPSEGAVMLTVIPEKLLVSGWLIAMFRANIRQPRTVVLRAEAADDAVHLPPEAALRATASSREHSRFFIRQPGSSSYSGPFSAREIAERLAIGKLSEVDLAIVAAGQPHGELKRSPDHEWTPLGTLFSQR